MPVTDLKGRVKKRLDELEINPFEAARRAGLERSYVNDILISRKRTVRDSGLQKLAEALECDPEYLTGHQSTPHRLQSDQSQGMPVVLTCETGAWRSAGSPVSATTIPVLPDPRFPGVANIAAVARGDGAELAGIVDGDVIVYLDWSEWSQRFGALQDGALYVVRRFRVQFNEVEYSIRRAVVTGVSAKFVAESDHDYPDIELRRTDTEVVDIIGVVACMVRPLI